MALFKLARKCPMLECVAIYSRETPFEAYGIFCSRLKRLRILQLDQGSYVCYIYFSFLTVYFYGDLSDQLLASEIQETIILGSTSDALITQLCFHVSRPDNIPKKR